MVSAELGATVPVSGEPSFDTRLMSQELGDYTDPWEAMPRLGRYLLTHRLGSGGMGVVFAAYDRELDRRVALKVLRRDVDVRGQARLRQEARALAQLAHPNVVTIYNVDVLDGRLVLAMEYIEGETLNQWLDSSIERPWMSIVEMFMQAGDGLAAAHAADIVHRDFKPSNVLVDASGRARVLDFGLARSFGGGGSSTEFETLDSCERSGSGTVVSLTCTGFVMGTPRYMAPEQHLARPVDARTDVFSFCVALYEAVYRQHPFCERGGRSLRQAVLAGQPIAPGSKRAPEALWRVVRRGLERDPASRWPSMHELLEALRRLRSPRRFGWSTGAILLGGLTMTAAGAWQRTPSGCENLDLSASALWSESMRSAAAQAFSGTRAEYGPHAWKRISAQIDAYAEQWTSARGQLCGMHELDTEVRELAVICLERRRHDLDALVRLLANPDDRVIQHAVEAATSLEPVEPCLEPRLRDPYALDSAESRAATEDVLTQAALVRTQLVGGRYQEALSHARELVARVENEGHHLLAGRAFYLLGSAEAHVGQSEQAVQTLEQAVLLAYASGDDVVAADAATERVYQLGQVLKRYDEALRGAQQAGALISRTDSVTDRDILEGKLANAVGNVLQGQGRLDEARAEYERAHDLLRRAEGPFSAKVARSLNNLGNVTFRSGDADAAEGFYRQAYATWSQVLGEDHPDAIKPLMNLSIVAIAHGKPKVAEQMLREVIAALESSLGPEHQALGEPLMNLGILLSEQGRQADSLPFLERSLAIREAQFGPDHPDVAQSHAELAFSLLMLDRCEDAVAHYERALRGFDAAPAPQAVELPRLLANLAVCRAELAEPEIALHYARRSLELRVKQYGSEHPQLSHSLHPLGVVQLQLGRHKDAIATLARAVELRERDYRSPSSLAAPRFDLARAWLAAGRDRVTALRWAQQSREEYLLGHEQERADEVAAWIAAHKRPRASS